MKIRRPDHVVLDLGFARLPERGHCGGGGDRAAESGPRSALAPRLVSRRVVCELRWTLFGLGMGLMFVLGFLVREVLGWAR